MGGKSPFSEHVQKRSRDRDTGGVKNTTPQPPPKPPPQKKGLTYPRGVIGRRETFPNGKRKGDEAGRNNRRQDAKNKEKSPKEGMGK